MFLIWPEHRGDGSIAGDEHMRHGPDVMDFLLGRVPAPSSRPGIDDHPARSASGGGAHRTVALFAPISRPIPESIPARHKPITPLSSTTKTRKYGIGSLLLEPSFYQYRLCRPVRSSVVTFASPFLVPERCCATRDAGLKWTYVRLATTQMGTLRTVVCCSRAPRDAAGKPVPVLGIVTLARTERRTQIRNLLKLSAARLADAEGRAAVIWTNWTRHDMRRLRRAGGWTNRVALPGGTSTHLKPRLGDTDSHAP